MHPYVLMIQTDIDDREITEAILNELEYNVAVKFIPSLEGLDTIISENGLPSVLILNNRGITHSDYSLLKMIKERAGYDHIPVVILGELAVPDHIRDWYRAGANSYIIKPSSIDSTRKKIKTFFEYWFHVAEVG